VRETPVEGKQPFGIRRTVDVTVDFGTMRSKFDFASLAFAGSEYTVDMFADDLYTTEIGEIGEVFEAFGAPEMTPFVANALHTRAYTVYRSQRRTHHAPTATQATCTCRRK
jgi:hypothetical protein